MRYYEIHRPEDIITATVEYRKVYSAWCIVLDNHKDKPLDSQIWNRANKDFRYRMTYLSEWEKKTLLEAGFKLLDDNGEQIK